MYLLFYVSLIRYINDIRNLAMLLSMLSDAWMGSNILLLRPLLEDYKRVRLRIWSINFLRGAHTILNYRVIILFALTLEISGAFTLFASLTKKLYKEIIWWYKEWKWMKEQIISKKTLIHSDLSDWVRSGSLI